MTDNDKTSSGSGLKTALQKIDSQIMLINKDISDNALIILNLKNEASKLNNMFDTRYEQMQRNIKMDVQKFEQQIERNYKNHTNSRKLLQKKVKDIEKSQIELAQNLYEVEKKVSSLEESLG